MLLARSAYTVHAAARTWGGACAQVSTLASERICATDVLDLRARQQPRVEIAGERARLQYARKANSRAFGDHIPFPEHARGFLYLHHPDAAHPAAAELRFRVLPAGADAPQEAFASGADLEVVPATPWRIPAVSACRHAKYQPLARLLLRDGVLPRATLDAWKRMPIISIKTQTPLLHKLEQPFAWELGSSGFHICVAHGRRIDYIKVQSALHDLRHNHVGAARPHTGRALCRLERGVSASGEAVLHIRVLEALTPFASVDPAYDGYYPLPRVGDLLRGPRGPLELHMRSGLAKLALLC